MTFDPRDPAFFDPPAAEKVLARVTELPPHLLLREAYGLPEER